MRVLVVNAGSSSLRLALLDDDQLLEQRHIEGDNGLPEESELRDALSGWDSPDAVGHRVVHGGGEFTDAVRVDETVRDRLAEFAELAPLHQPPALDGIDAMAKLYPDVPNVACFDTAFHSTLPAAAYTYAVPEEWRERLGVRRFGFHGLSHAYASSRAANMLAENGNPVRRFVICHLGAGASLSAVLDGRCVDTTMGFTPLEGLVMATRPGDVDPGLLIWVQRRAGLGVDELEHALQKLSGLNGLAGTPDMREVVERAGKDDSSAELALDVYVHRLRSGIAAMAAALDGLDGLVFTGGVGEHAPVVRSKTVAGLGFLGISLDDDRNNDADPDVDIAASDSVVRCLVIAAREDLRIAGEVRRVLSG